MKNLKKIQKAPVRELIALHLISNLGAQRIRSLLQFVDHPREIFHLDRQNIESVYGIGPKTAEEIITFNSWDKVDWMMDRTQRLGAEIMTFWDEDYPPLLRETFDPPLMLWIKGSRKVLQNESVAIVGTRKAGKYGLDTAEYFSRELARKGLTVVSGLALGVDGAAHRATVRENGCTIAVLGSGIDVIYPQQHRKLAADIVDTGGAVISEFPLEEPPDAGNFPVRNRIVSGLSLGTLVVASGIDGGSMITAKSALDQNREVFVVPHAIGTPNSIGCHSLIQRGMGKLVQNVEDILEEIEVHLTQSDPDGRSAEPASRKWTSLDLDELSTAVCEALEEEPLHIDDLAEQLDTAAHKLLPKLLELEMQHCVRQSAGKNFELL